ncbi:MAG: peptide-methionine (S)-S-oxide reductase MsrA, partial [Planctomycetota bacterium]
ESIRIVYDPQVISYEKLLEVHFKTHDPTQLNRQGNDIGTHYRSAIFYANAEQKALAESYIEKLNASGEYAKKIVTTLEPLENYSRAEEYHQDYAARNPNQGYIRAVSQPKVDKVHKYFDDLLKPESADASGG